MTQPNETGHKPITLKHDQIYVQGVGLVTPATQKFERPSTNTLGVSVYLIEIVKGLGNTLGHALANMVKWRQFPTVSYPEVTRDIPEGWRGKHRLTTREDGSTKCVACMMCATACPAECIHIIPAESENPDIERFPERFDIDLLECVFCGMCVEACPVDAIRMDSGVYSLTAFDRESFLITKEELVQVQPNPHPEGKVFL